jgi:hypothetical protein
MIGDQEFMEAALQEKLKDPSRALAIEIFQFLRPKADLNTTVILSALSMVLATVAVEAGMEEEKAVYAFRKSYGNSKRRLKSIMRTAQ